MRTALTNEHVRDATADEIVRGMRLLSSRGA